MFYLISSKVGCCLFQLKASKAVSVLSYKLGCLLKKDLFEGALFLFICLSIIFSEKYLRYHEKLSRQKATAKVTKVAKPLFYILTVRRNSGHGLRRTFKRSWV